MRWHDQGVLVRLDVGPLNNRGERFALLAGEVCKGLAGKPGELDCKGVEAFAYIHLSWPTAFSSAVNLSIMIFGTPIGAIHPNQACTSKPFFNVSAMVGMSGAKPHEDRNGGSSESYWAYPVVSQGSAFPAI
jgi:hypothetical protein